MIRVRFAPSPTGYLHIGGLRTALYNKLFADHNGGTFFLRVEDTDRSRYVEGAVESLLRTLKWAGITPDEGPYLNENGEVAERGEFGPYTQSKRTEKYKATAEILVRDGHAYHCFCTPERLDQMRKEQELAKQPVVYDRRCRNLTTAEVESRIEGGEHHVIRFKMPTEGKTTFTDLIRGVVSFENGLLDDFVIMKGDGFPTYHLAHIVDDHEMQTTHVLRAEEWLPSTPKHLCMFAACGWAAPEYAHLPLLLNADRSKLSKRQGDVAVEDYRDKGYLPEAVVNFIATCGWNPTGDREVFSYAELAEMFDIGSVNKAGSIFNREKLDWLNREYMKAMSTIELAEAALPFVAPEWKGVSSSDRRFRAMIELERTRANTLVELVANAEMYLKDDVTVDPTSLPWKKSTKDVAMDRLSGMIEFCEMLPAESFEDLKVIETAVIAYIVDKGWTNAETLWPMRVALSGRAASPSPFELCWALGREVALARLHNAIKLLA